MKNTIALNSDIHIDLPKLIESRLLVQANSGGGKSWANRRIIEQAFGKVQIIVIDPEGEFANMRAKYDFVYAGKGGDAPVESRSAALLARRLLELKASAIIDLYELNPQERKHFVRLFLDAMVNGPKDLWHDCLVILDEAHKFAPEKEQSEALEAVIDMASRGRKRGYCLIPATQRPAKLNKDVAAECNNKLIGRASLDIDRKRSADELGFTTKEEILSLRNLEPGEFYVFGPAISRDVVKTTIGDVNVKPPVRGESRAVPPSPTDKVRKILSKLADLPHEAEEEAKTVADFKAQNSQLKRELTLAKAAQPKPVTTRLERIEVPMVGKKALAFIEKSIPELRKLIRESKTVFAASEANAQRFEDSMNKLLAQIAKVQQPTSGKGVTITTQNANKIIQRTLRLTEELPSQGHFVGGLSGPEQRILDAIAWMESIGIVEPEQTAVAFLAGYTYGGGGFNNPRGALRTKGMLEYRGNKIALTEAGRAEAKVPDTSLTTEELHDRVLAVLPGPEQKLLKELLAIYPNDIAKDELAERVGYAPGSGGFNNPCGRLRTLGLVEYTQPGKVKAKDLLFLN